MSKDRDEILKWCVEGHGTITEEEAHQMSREIMNHVGYALELQRLQGAAQVFGLRDHLIVCKGCKFKI